MLERKEIIDIISDTLDEIATAVRHTSASDIMKSPLFSSLVGYKIAAKEREKTPQQLNG